MGKTQIADTKLFTDAQKIALLAKFDELSEADLKYLSDTIEDFDRTYAASLSKLKSSLEETVGALLEDVQADSTDVFFAAAERIKKGLSILSA